MTEFYGFVEQHIHGAFGTDFMQCTKEELHFCAKKLTEFGVCAFFPTLMTDDINKIKERISLIKECMGNQKPGEAIIEGIHLEGPFINPEKSGIHDKKYILPPDIETYKQIEDESIKILTLAPETDETGEFIKYLKTKGIKISAGHCVSADITGLNQVTHLYNAMGNFTHRGESTVISALADDDIYTEIIADSVHVSDEVLKITFRQKPVDKIILISDALPPAHSDKQEHVFAGQTIYNSNGKAVNADGILAGSTMILFDIVKNIIKKGLMSTDKAIQCASDNIIKYHDIKPSYRFYTDKEFEIITREKI